MAIEYQGDTAILKGICTIEEAEDFFEWLKNEPSPCVNMEEMEHIHTAILQGILLVKPTIKGIKENTFWGRFIFNTSN